MNIEGIEKAINSYLNVTLIKSSSNIGIASALNQICKKALSDGFNWILTLDHDSICPQEMISSMTTLVDLKYPMHVAIVCPRITYENMSVIERGNTKNRYTEVFACMTSGSMMSLDAWQKTGGFDDYMFIDWVDNDICFRFKLKGYSIIRDNNVFMSHQLGNVRKVRILLWSINDYNYPEMRIYHIMRNGIYFLRKHWAHFSLKYKIKHIFINIIQFFKFLYLFRRDSSKLRNVKNGKRDGFKSIPIKNI